MELLPMIGVLVALLVVAARLTGRHERQTILDYQRGIRFEQGQPRDVLSPGCHHFRPSNEKITVVDLRNQPVIVERFAYRDSTNETAWISIFAAFQVVDAHRAISLCHDHVDEAVLLIRDVLRRDLSARPASEVRWNRRGCEQELKTQMVGELEKIGLALTVLEITEVSSPATDGASGSTGVH